MDNQEFQEKDSDANPSDKNRQKGFSGFLYNSFFGKSIKKKALAWIASLGCSCCLPILVGFLTIGIITITIFYIMNFFSDDSNPASQPQTTISNGSK